jgi:hypothetical protein
MHPLSVNIYSSVSNEDHYIVKKGLETVIALYFRLAFLYENTGHELFP